MAPFKNKNFSSCKLFPLAGDTDAILHDWFAIPGYGSQSLNISLSIRIENNKSTTGRIKHNWNPCRLSITRVYRQLST